jgi:hypothetical protein
MTNFAIISGFLICMVAALTLALAAKSTKP